VAPLLIGVDVTGTEEDASPVISEAIDRALADNKPEMADERAAFVYGRYAWAASADRYAEILDGLIAGRRAAA
jgi:hypothetical protein